jgi:hypothetical protein
MAQKEEGNTTEYLDTVNIPPVINSGPRLLKKGNDNGDDRREKVQWTDTSASAANGLRSGSKVEGNVVHVENVLVEGVTAMSV